MTRYQRWRQRLPETLANVRAEALLHSLADTGAEVEAETFYVLKPYAEVETLNEVEAVALVYTQDHKFSEVQAKSVTDTPRLRVTLLKVERQTLGNTLHDGWPRHQLILWLKASRSQVRDTTLCSS